MKELIVDLFAGGGGASSGIEAAGFKVDIAINHDPEAIALHEANHPDAKHYNCDIWEVDPKEACGFNQVKLLWASPDCKHFSKAKGGKPVEKNIRSLAWVVVDWAKKVRPKTIILENVEEFKTWGPLNKNNRPDKKRKGETFKKFIKSLRDLGYLVEWKELRACDYGAPTIRKRLFVIATLTGTIVWPEPTHGIGKVPYKTAANIIDWSVPAPSIFTRKRPLAEKTMARIAKGIERFVLNGDKRFILGIDHRGSGDNTVYSENEPLTTITTKGRHALVSLYIAKHYTGVVGSSMKEPLSTITTKDHNALVVAYLQRHFGKSVGSAIKEPVGTITAGGGGKTSLVSAFLTKYYGNESGGHNLQEPIGTITTKDRFSLITVEIDGEKYFIKDIGMRMLTPKELFKAQGFSSDYIIDIDYKGKKLTKTAQVRMCGNSVCPPIAKALVEANISEDLEMVV